MLGRFVAAVAIVAGITFAASAQDVKPPEIEFGRYHALVIGNNDYPHLRNLTTAVGDAEAVATLLEEKYGFQITKLINATRRDITGALNHLRKTLTDRDNLLVYYAGHGVLDEEAGAGYWLPVDARSDDDSDWFSNTRLTNYLKAMSAQHVMVVADSCYSGNLTRVATSSVRSGAERTAWMERMNGKRSRTALTSGGLEPVLDQGGGGHSVFARAFLTALDESPDVLFGEELFDRVKGVVVANADQTPEYSDIRHTGHEKGDFLFVPRDINISVTVQTPPPVQPDREVVFWQSIQDSTDPADFDAYLEKYPSGEFVRLARNRLNTIREQRTALAVPPAPKVTLEPVDATYVAIRNANVREEPTVRSARVATLNAGASVHVAGKVKGKNWYLIEREEKALGYVFGELLQDAESVRREEEAKRREAARRQAELAKQQEEQRQRGEEARRRKEARRKDEIVRQQEEARQHAEETLQKEAERKRAEQARVAAVLSPPTPRRQRAAPRCKDHLPNIRIDAPDSEVPQQFAQFAGIWRGMWGGQLCSGLAVKSVDEAGRFQIVYSWADGRDHDGSRFDGGYSSHSGQIRNGKIIFGRRSKFTFRINEMGELDGKRFHTPTGKTARVTMRRVAITPDGRKTP